MKNLKVLVAVAGSTLGLAGVSYGLNDSFNFDRINANLQNALSQVAGRSDIADRFNVKILENQTDVDKGRYAASFALRLREAAWTDERVALSGQIRFDASTQDRLNRMFINFQFNTESVALLKHLATMCECPVADSVVGVDRIHMESHCSMADQLKNAVSVMDIRSAAEGSVKDLGTDLATYRTELNSSLAMLTGNMQISTLLQGQLGLTDRLATAIAGTKFEDLQNGFRMTMPSFRYDDKLTLESYRLSVQPEQLNVTIALASPLGSMMHAASKPEIERFLTALERNQNFAREMVQMDARIFLNMWQEFNRIAQ